MHLVVVGISHKTAPVEVREKLALPDVCLPEAVRSLSECGCVSECCIISTCNRTEVYAITHSRDDEEAIVAFLSQACSVPRGLFEDALYRHRGHKAIEHLFGVASGLDSMMIGEVQILGQVKDAFACAGSGKATRTVLNALFRHAIRTGKRVRTETGISRGAFSVGYAVVELAKSVFGGLAGRSVLILGAGKMAELTARHMQTAGAGQVVVANRTPSRAKELAERLGGRAAAFSRVADEMLNADFVIGSTGSAQPVLTRAQVEEALPRRSGRPLFVIDIAVPRDFDPSIASLHGVHLYNIDDLRGQVDCFAAEREKDIGKAREIVADETHAFLGWLRSREGVPLIRAIRAKLEGIRDAEWERVSGRFAHLTDEERKAIRAAMQSLLNRVSHDPLVTIKEYAANDDGADRLEVARELFGIPPDEPGSAGRSRKARDA